MSQKKRLRLISVSAQFELVVDDGTTLTPLVLTDKQGNSSLPGARISAKDWPTYAETGFKQAIQELEDQLHAQENSSVDPKSLK